MSFVEKWKKAIGKKFVCPVCGYEAIVGPPTFTKVGCGECSIEMKKFIERQL